MPALPGISRTQVVAGDSLRGRLVAWDRQRRLPDMSVKWTMTDSAGKVTPLVRLDQLNVGKAGDWWDQFYHGEVLIPPGLKPGQYKMAAGPVTWPLEIVSLPSRKPRKSYGPGTALGVVQGALDAGNDVLLQAGLYEWDVNAKRLVLPLNCTLTGPGAIIRYSGKPVDDPSKVSFFDAGAWATIDGITFEGPAGEYRVNTQNSSTNLTMIGCTFRNAIVVAPGPSMHIEDCQFQTSRLWTGGYGGLIRRNVFTGQINEPLSIWSADHCLATIDNDFIGTGRGPTYNVGWGDVRGNLSIGTNVSGVNWLTNGCESELCEPSSAGSPNGFHDNISLHYRNNSVGGSSLQWDGRASSNLVLEAKIDGAGFSLGGDNIDGNDFDTIEFRNGFAVVMGRGCTNNRFANIAIVNPQPSAWNQHWIDAAWYTGWRACPITWDDGKAPGAGNSFTNLTVRSDPQYPLTPGPSAITWTNCTRNGVAYP